MSSKYYLLFVNRKQFMSSKYYSYFLLIENNLCHQNITHRKQFMSSKYYEKTIYVIKILLILFVNRKQFMSSKYYYNLCHTYFVNRKQFMSSKYYSYFLLIENNLCHQNITHTFC